MTAEFRMSFLAFGTADIQLGDGRQYALLCCCVGNAGESLLEGIELPEA